VATKSDRLSNNQLVNSLRKFRQEYPEVKIVPFSARTGVGKQELWQEIRTNIATNSAEEPVAED
jgi:GTPase Era involved in 16S rRNA processing